MYYYRIIFKTFELLILRLRHTETKSKKIPKPNSKIQTKNENSSNLNLKELLKEYLSEMILPDLIGLEKFNEIRLDLYDETNENSFLKLRQELIDHMKRGEGLDKINKQVIRQIKNKKFRKLVDKKILRDLIYSQLNEEVRVRIQSKMGENESLPLIFKNLQILNDKGTEIFDLNLTLGVVLLEGHGVLSLSLGENALPVENLMESFFKTKFSGKGSNPLHRGTVDVNLDINFFEPRDLVFINLYGEYAKDQEKLLKW